MRLLAWLVGLAITLAFVRLGPGRDIPADLIGAHLQALLAVALWTAASLGAGGATLKRLAPRALQSPTGWAHALVTGLLLWGLGGLVLGAAGQLNTPGLAILFGVLGAGWLARPALQGPGLSPTELTAGLAILLPLLLLSLAPATSTDALYTHLGVPAQMLMDGSLVGGMLHPQGSRPLILHLPYAALMHSGGASAPGVMHLLLSAAVLALVVQIGAVHLGKRAAGLAAALLLMGSWTFLRETGRPGNDVVAALATLVALDAALRGHGRALAIAAGTALSIKYTAAGALVGIFLVAQLPWRSRILAGLGALALLVPWWGRNLLHGLHPLFPFTGWPETAVPMAFQYLEKYGAGRAPLDFAMLPWRVFMDSEIDSFRFMGRLNPAWLVLAPFGLWVARKRGAALRITVAGLVGAAAWAAGPQWLRYLLPALPLLALAAGAGMLVRAPRALAASALLAGLVGLPANWLDVIRTAADRIEVVTGEESKEDYLARHHHGYEAISWANAHLPEDARVAMLFSWAGVLLERRQVLGSVEDHVPTRHWILRHGDQSLHKLSEAGVTHAVVRRARFLKNAYPFLTPEQRAQHLQAPVHVLQDSLLMQAQLLAQEGPIRIYRLPEAPSGS